MILVDLRMTWYSEKKIWIPPIFRKQNFKDNKSLINDLFNNTETHGYEQWHGRSIYHLTRQGQLILNWTLSTPKKLNESRSFPWYQRIVFTFLKITFTCHQENALYITFTVLHCVWKLLSLFHPKNALKITFTFFLFCFKITFPFHSDKCFIDHFHFSPFSLKITFIFFRKKLCRSLPLFTRKKLCRSPFSILFENHFYFYSEKCFVYYFHCCPFSLRITFTFSWKSFVDSFSYFPSGQKNAL